MTVELGLDVFRTFYKLFFPNFKAKFCELHDVDIHRKDYTDMVNTDCTAFTSYCDGAVRVQTTAYTQLNSTLL